VVTVAVAALETHWRCLEASCDAEGTGTARDADKAAEKHGKTVGHATLTWSEPTLPIKVPAR
jgi:hypothetical protein